MSEDHTERSSAERYAARLAAYWHREGYTGVRFWVTPIETKRGTHWEVRSNLVRGLPLKENRHAVRR